MRQRYPSYPGRLYLKQNNEDIFSIFKLSFHCSLINYSCYTVVHKVDNEYCYCLSLFPRFHSRSKRLEPMAVCCGSPRPEYFLKSLINILAWYLYEVLFWLGQKIIQLFTFYSTLKSSMIYLHPPALK